ncbi:MAG: Gfo/Idh/MocA family oxidoreductase [Clostridiales bacterium]|nr:Gfo/Idh/MocA family oxidoreductase [Clostridiales bacterium]
MKKVRYGIIGLGNQGCTYNLGLFDKGAVPQSEVTAMCDVNPQKIEYMKSKTTNETAVYFTDYKEMLDSGLVDAVLVEVPHYQHPEMVMECLKRGIHVICEKPAGVYAKQVREMNEFAKERNALFGMMFNQRMNPLYQKMREMVQSGEVGELMRVNWVITDWYRTQAYYDSGSWRATWSGEGGGVLINQCPHQLDLVQWIVGKLPVKVNGFCQYGRWHDIEVEDEVTAYFEYDNGATGVFVTTTGEAPGVNRFEITGTLGRLVCENEKLTFYRNQEDLATHVKTCKGGFSRPACVVEEVKVEGVATHHAGVINNFSAAIMGEEELFVRGEDGINGVQLMNAIEFSGWNGGVKVSLPVDEEAYLALLKEKCANSKNKQVEEKVTDTSGTY